MQELITAIHMHTRFSDGSGLHQDLANAGLEAGVDALLVSDHNVLAQGGLRATIKKADSACSCWLAKNYTIQPSRKKVPICLFLGTIRSFPATRANRKTDRPGKRRWRAQLHRPPD